MLRKLFHGVLLLGGIAMMVWAAMNWNVPEKPDAIAQPVLVNTTATSSVEGVSTTTTTLETVTQPSTITTAPPPPRGDVAEQVVCALPVEINIYFSAVGTVLSAPIDISDTRFNPARNRVDIHTSEANGLPCADTSLPVKLLGHKQHQFCYLVLEDPSFDPCEYGVELGNLVEIVLEDGEVVTYEVVEPLPSEVAKPLSEVYVDITDPTPAVMFRKYTEYQQFYDEVFSREDASDEMWLFTSCGNDIQGGHSQDACAVRTEFRTYTGIDATTPEEAEMD